jgi:hypothetical protein
MAFSDWLATDRPRTVLAFLKFAYESGGAPAEGTVYLCRNGHPRRQPFITGASDTPANTPFRDAIRGAPTIVRTAPIDALGGSTQIEISELVLDNPDGCLDFLLDLVMDGREAQIYLGDHAWPIADFELVTSAVIDGVSASGDDQITVTLRDKRRLLNKDIAGSVVNDERRKPIVLTATATALSIEPVEKSAANLQYWCIENFANASLSQVYDNGVPLRNSTTPLFVANNASMTANAGTDTITRAAHGLAVNDVVVFDGFAIFAGLTMLVQYWVISAGLTANDFRVSLTKGGAAVDITGTVFAGNVGVYRHRAYSNISADGSIELSSTPAGRLTVDISGISPSYSLGFAGVGECIRAALIDYGGLDSSEVDAASFRAISGTLIGNFDVAARAVLGRENLIGVLDDLARTVQMFYGPDHEGVFRAGRFDLSALSAATATRTLSSADLALAPSVRNVPKITGTVAVQSRRNYRPLSYGELAASVAVDDKRALAAQYREMGENTAPAGTGYSTNWQSYHLTAVRVEASGAFAETASDISDIADEILGDLKPHVKVIDLATDLTAYDWNLGDVVTFTYPRYGFDAGHKCRVARIATNLDEERVELTLITHMAPDTTTASYP